MKVNFFLFFILAFNSLLNAQKTAYIPPFLLDPTNVNSNQFSWSKTFQSDNFTLIWGNTVGLDPSTYPDQQLSFNPITVTNYLEAIYTHYKNLGFIIDTIATKKIAQYKVPIIMNNTWGDSPGAIVGFAEAYDDGFMPIFNIHPIATNGGAVLAHEFAHCLQGLVKLDELSPLNPMGNPFADGAHIFYETHAEFLASTLFPEIVEIRGMDNFTMSMWGDWKNTYRNYPLLQHILLKHGIQRVNDLWFQQLDNEYPIATYKRISNFTQSQLNDDLFEYARRMAVLDFGIWSQKYRLTRNDNTLYQDLQPIQNRYTILEQGSGANHYKVPDSFAPEEYGYNIIPIYPEMNSDCIKIKFKGHTEVDSSSAGWRFGIVASNLDGSLHSYSPTYSNNVEDFVFEVSPDMSQLYLVIMGAPADYVHQDAEHDTWTGYPKHYRYPYELLMENAVPEGFQDKILFRPYLKTQPGNYHINGGGWVDSSASVAPNVYVNSHACVLGNSNIFGTNIRVEGTAIVRDAQIGNNVHVLNNSVVIGGNAESVSLVTIKENAFIENNTITGSTIIKNRAIVSNYNLSGNIIVGGDVIVYATESCDNGVYYNLTNYYANNPLACDNRTESHPSNININQPHIPFTPSQIVFVPGLTCNSLHTTYNEINEIKCYPNPASDEVYISGIEKIDNYEIYNSLGQLIVPKKILINNRIVINELVSGYYTLLLYKKEKQFIIKLFKK